MNIQQLEARLTDSFDSTADAVAVSAPPAFTWQSQTPAAPRATRHVSRRASYATSGLAAAAAAVIVAATGSGLHDTATIARARAGSADVSTTGPSQDAPRLLLAAARTRLQSGDPSLTDGQYRYVRITSPAPVNYVGAQQTQLPPAGSYTLDEYWIPKDQSGLWMRRTSTPGDPSSGASATWTGKCGDLYADAQDGPNGPACTRPGSFADPTPAFIAGLPRNPAALYEQLHTYAAKHLNPDKIHNPGFEMFSTIDSLLSSGILNSDLTSSFYTVLSRIPGIHVLDGAKNFAGAAGTGFRLRTTLGQGANSSPDIAMIIINLASGAYLGTHYDAPGLHQASAVTVGVADRIGEAGQ